MRQVDGADEFECHVFATGMHALSRYGATWDEIRKSGLPNIFLYINQFADGASPDMTLAHTITGLAHYVREFRPDLIVVHGDRPETLAGAIVGAFNNILVAHVEGGERSGTMDELIRHAVSKLSHLHFVANEEAEARVLQLGELPASVFVIGSPDIDVMLSEDLPPLADVLAHYEIPFSSFCIFAYHPVTTELHRLRENAAAARDALLASGRNFVVIYPNNDPGADVILEELRLLEHESRFRMFPSLRFESFLTLLKHADAIVGNSSAGVREAPVYGVPTVNIGTRQSDRFDYPSIVNVPENVGAIVAALKNLPVGVTPSLHFGAGDSARKFLKCLRTPALWRTCRQKQFNDLAAAPLTTESLAAVLAR